MKPRLKTGQLVLLKYSGQDIAAGYITDELWSKTTNQNTITVSFSAPAFAIVLDEKNYGKDADGVFRFLLTPAGPLFMSDAWIVGGPNNR